MCPQTTTSPAQASHERHVPVSRVNGSLSLKDQFTLNRILTMGFIFEERKTGVPLKFRQPQAAWQALPTNATAHEPGASEQDSLALGQSFAPIDLLPCIAHQLGFDARACRSAISSVKLSH